MRIGTLANPDYEISLVPAQFFIDALLPSPFVPGPADILASKDQTGAPAYASAEYRTAGLQDGSGAPQDGSVETQAGCGLVSGGICIQSIN